MMCQSHLLHDQHSSEEELEVINGPSSVAAAEAAAAATTAAAASGSTAGGGGCGGGGGGGGGLLLRGTASSLISERDSSSLEPDELFGEAATSKRSSSTLIENRKRSLAHSSDDELRNFLEPILTPVNFRTSPPLEAFKPNRAHVYRSTTPLILSEARCGIENIKLCDNSVNEENGVSGGGCGATSDNHGGGGGGCPSSGGSGSGSGSGSNVGCPSATDTECTSGIKACPASLKMSNSSHHIYQPQPKYNFHYNSSRSSPASTTGLDVEVRSVSPPAKLFHCAISPRRRPIRGQHPAQRLQRPHRPCLDFDKMQQVSL